MRTKIIAVLSSVILLIAVISGIICKNSYVYYDDLKYYEVGVISENLVDIVTEYVDEIITECSNIAKVEPISDIEIIFNSTQQHVKVLEVYKGTDLHAGDIITVTPISSCVFEDFMSINMGFTNCMKMDREYLVLLGPRLETLDEKQQVYETADCLITTVFCYSDSDNIVVTPKSADNLSVPYTAVQNNEFFAASEESLAKMVSLKKRLLEMYP